MAERDSYFQPAVPQPFQAPDLSLAGPPPFQPPGYPDPRNAGQNFWSSAGGPLVRSELGTVALNGGLSNPGLFSQVKP
jgi:hypothetical protein